MSAIMLLLPVSSPAANGQTVPKNERPLVAVVARKRSGRNPPTAAVEGAAVGTAAPDPSQSQVAQMADPASRRLQTWQKAASRPGRSFRRSVSFFESGQKFASAPAVTGGKRQFALYDNLG
jgi:hypothetical protein